MIICYVSSYEIQILFCDNSSAFRQPKVEIQILYYDTSRIRSSIC